MERVGQLYRRNLVKSIKDGVSQNKNAFLLKYSAISSPQMSDLRKNLKRIGAHVHVSKNRLAQIALKEIEKERLGQDIEGQIAFVWSNVDAVTLAKALFNFSKGCEGLIVQRGLIEGIILEKEEIKRLSDLPSREVLLSQLLGTIQAPLTRFAGVLNGKSRELLSILKQLSERAGKPADRSEG